MGGFIVVIILFAATISGASLYNNAMVSLNERQRDIATFTVLGCPRWEIFRIFLSEGIILLVLGLVLGAPFCLSFKSTLDDGISNRVLSLSNCVVSA